MSLKTAKKFLEVFAKVTENADKISLTFYGGEPLLNAEVVYKSMSYVRQLERERRFQQPVDMTLLTNGVLVDEMTVEAVLETQTGVSISIDGPEPLHDAARVTTAGKGSFKKALRAYRMFEAAGVTPGISCTLNRHNIGNIEEIARFIATELRPPGMGFNILLPMLGGGNPLDVRQDLAASQLIRAFKILREHGIYEDRVMRRVTPYQEQGFHFKDCMGVGGQLVVTPDGEVGPCQALLGVDGYFPLTVDDLHVQLDSLTSETIYENPLFNEWRHRFPLNMAECADCWAIAICGGGCPYAALVNHGSIWEIDERICYQAKQILEWMIWDTFDHFEEGKAGSATAQQIGTEGITETKGSAADHVVSA